MRFGTESSDRNSWKKLRSRLPLTPGSWRKCSGLKKNQAKPASSDGCQLLLRDIRGCSRRRACGPRNVDPQSVHSSLRKVSGRVHTCSVKCCHWLNGQQVWITRYGTKGTLQILYMQNLYDTRISARFICFYTVVQTVVMFFFIYLLLAVLFFFFSSSFSSSSPLFRQPLVNDECH